MPITTAVVMAAGEGRRLRPLTRYRPKPLLPAANRPLLEYVLDSLVDAGVDEIHLVVGYRRDRVQEHVGSSYRGADVEYHVQEKQLGSGHALLQAAPGIDGGFLAVNGDQIVDPAMVRDVREAHGDAIATLGVIESERAANYGVVELEGDRVVDVTERPTDEAHGHLLNAGVYAFMPDVFRAIEETPPVDGERGLPDTIERLVEADEYVRGVRTAGTWVDATYPWDLLTVAAELLTAGRVDEPELGADGGGGEDDGTDGEGGGDADDRIGPAGPTDGVYVAESARIHPSAVLRGPVVVGTDAVVGPGAVVGPETALGRGVRVGANAVVEASVLDADTTTGANATVVDCVTGEAAELGAGSVVPGGPGDVRVEATVHEATPLGGLVADRATVAGGAVVAPGTLIGPEARVGVGCLARGRVPEDADVTR